MSLPQDKVGNLRCIQIIIASISIGSPYTLKKYRIHVLANNKSSVKITHGTMPRVPPSVKLSTAAVYIINADNKPVLFQIPFSRHRLLNRVTQMLSSKL